MKKFDIPSPKSRFLRVRCPSCNHEQIVFDRPAQSLRCVSCKAELARSGASKPEWFAKVVKVLD